MTNHNKYKKIKNLCDDFYLEMDKLVTQVFCNIEINQSEYFCDLKNYLFGNSKQIRSCLIFLFSKNLGLKSSEKDIIKLAAATEIIHNATLIHDDIIDNSPIRRGAISIHQKYNNKLGVISGDFLLSVALNLLLELPPQVMKNFGTCLNSLCLGEINQYFSIKSTQTIYKYLKKSEQKTSSLFIAALKSLMEIKNHNSTNQISHFAQHFGLAFQIRDDLKNIINHNQNTKPIFNDIEQGVYTAPVIYAFGENKNLTELSAKEIIDKASDQQAISQTKTLLNNEILTAIENINFLPENDYKTAIINLCNLLSVIR